MTHNITDKPWISRKNNKTVKIKIKIQILLWKTIKGNRSLRVTLRVWVKFLLFYSGLAPQTRDVTCSRIYLDGKNMRRQCQMNTLIFSRTFLTKEPVYNLTLEIYARYAMCECYFYHVNYLPVPVVETLSLNGFFQKT